MCLYMHTAILNSTQCVINNLLHFYIVYALFLYQGKSMHFSRRMSRIMSQDKHSFAGTLLFSVGACDTEIIQSFSVQSMIKEHIFLYRVYVRFCSSTKNLTMWILWIALRRSPSGGSVSYHPHSHPTADCML